MDKESIKRQHPTFPWLGERDLPTLLRYLQGRHLLKPGEEVSEVARAGDGNMNLTLRVITNRRSFVVKQARPWVEKYDHIAAPWDRMVFEQRFYRRVGDIPRVAARMPRLLDVDPDGAVLILEDLGNGCDLTTLYRGGRLSDDELTELGDYLAALHCATLGSPDADFSNRQMRDLNHLHIFRVPFDSNSTQDLDIWETGLTKAAHRISADARFMAMVEETGARYVAEGRCLVHGDFFPGSWLRTSRGVRVIDPEFCFFGDPEFDLGCAIAHFALASQPTEVAQQLLDAYGASATLHLDADWISRYAACEVTRRLIGVAQLPIPRSDGIRSQLLDRARHALVRQDWKHLWN